MPQIGAEPLASPQAPVALARSPSGGKSVRRRAGPRLRGGGVAYRVA
jgi:hypothetical protein